MDAKKLKIPLTHHGFQTPLDSRNSNVIHRFKASSQLAFSCNHQPRSKRLNMNTCFFVHPLPVSPAEAPALNLWDGFLLRSAELHLFARETLSSHIWFHCTPLQPTTITNSSSTHNNEVFSVLCHQDNFLPLLAFIYLGFWEKLHFLNFPQGKLNREKPNGFDVWGSDNHIQQVVWCEFTSNRKRHQKTPTSRFC